MQKVHAHFARMIDARKALDTLKDLGFGSGYLDASDNFYTEYSEEINFAGSKTAPSLSGLVLRSRGSSSDIDKAPLTAANPIVSGMGRYEDISESLTASLIINVDEANTDQVREVIQKLGGTV